MKEDLKEEGKADYSKHEEAKLSYLSKKHGMPLEASGIPFVAASNPRTNLVIWNLSSDAYARFIRFLKFKEIDGHEAIDRLLDLAEMEDRFREKISREQENQAKPDEKKKIVVCGRRLKNE